MSPSRLPLTRNLRAKEEDVHSNEKQPKPYLINQTLDRWYVHYAHGPRLAGDNRQLRQAVGQQACQTKLSVRRPGQGLAFPLLKLSLFFLFIIQSSIKMANNMVYY